MSVFFVCVDFLSVCRQSLRQQRRIVGSESQWVMSKTGGQGCCDSHLGVGHRGLGGGVSVSGRGRVVPVLWWRLSVDGGFVQRLLGQGGHRHQGVSLVLFIHLESVGLRKENTDDADFRADSASL